jgi:hypothetical protein
MAREDRTHPSDESVSGAMRRGAAAGTPGGPIPRTDAADPGEESPTIHHAGGPGDGMRTGGSAGTASGHDPTPHPNPGVMDRGTREDRR